VAAARLSGALRGRLATLALVLGAGCSRGDQATTPGTPADGPADASTDAPDTSVLVPDTSAPDDPLADACGHMFDAAKTAGPFVVAQSTNDALDVFPSISCANGMIPADVEPILRAQSLRQCHDVVNAPGSSMTAAWLEACATATAQVPCGGQRPAECVPPPGTGADGADCRGDYQCADSWCLAGLCRTPTPIGGGCTVNTFNPSIFSQRCAAGSECVANAPDAGGVSMGLNGGGLGMCLVVDAGDVEAGADDGGALEAGSPQTGSASAWPGEPCFSNVLTPCAYTACSRGTTVCYDQSCPSDGVCPPLVDLEGQCGLPDGAPLNVTCGPYATCVDGVCAWHLSTGGN
jgi:hypothetical protein